jgi:peptidoglycan/LPS O-acetylase OafA/YrhL
LTIVAWSVETGKIARQPEHPTLKGGISMQPGTTTISKRIPGLDGLRGIAALIVVLSHTSIRKMYLAPGLDFGGIGKSGVYLFFVLSVMLLTSQMLEWS